MRIRVCFKEIDETLTAPDAASFLKLAKQKAASRAPLLLRAVVSRMSDLHFAAEIVRQSNAHTGKHDPPPRTAQEFLDWAIELQYATIETP